MEGAHYYHYWKAMLGLNDFKSLFGRSISVNTVYTHS